MISKLGSYMTIFFKGMLMGIADLVPGISGGTIALITGILQKKKQNLSMNFFQSLINFPRMSSLY